MLLISYQNVFYLLLYSRVSWISSWSTSIFFSAAITLLLRTSIANIWLGPYLTMPILLAGLKDHTESQGSKGWGTGWQGNWGILLVGNVNWWIELYLAWMKLNHGQNKTNCEKNKTNCIINLASTFFNEIIYLKMENNDIQLWITMNTNKYKSWWFNPIFRKRKNKVKSWGCYVATSDDLWSWFDELSWWQVVCRPDYQDFWKYRGTGRW